MTFFSVNVDGRSVAIDWATISMACDSRPCFLTKSSLARMAAALPSDVGLDTNHNRNILTAVTKYACFDFIYVLSRIRSHDIFTRCIVGYQIYAFVYAKQKPGLTSTVAW